MWLQKYKQLKRFNETLWRKVDERTDRRKNEQTNEQTQERTNEKTNGRKGENYTPTYILRMSGL